MDLLSVTGGPTLPADFTGLRWGGHPPTRDGPCVRGSNRRLWMIGPPWVSSQAGQLASVPGPLRGAGSHLGTGLQGEGRRGRPLSGRVAPAGRGTGTLGRAGLSPWVGPSRGSHQGDSGDQGGTHLREPLPAAAPPPSIRFPSLRVSCAEVRPLPSPPPAPSPGVSAPVTSCDAHVARTAALPARSLVTCCRDPARL